MSATNGYPFLSKRAIAERIRTDRAFALDAFQILLARTEQRTAAVRGSSGFMASHASIVRRLAVTLEQRPLDDAEHMKLAALLCRYARQIAAHLRTIEIQTRPELLAIASMFSAISTVTTGMPEAKDSDEMTVPETITPVVDVTAPRRRGRPKGSRNRVREEEPAPKRRRRS